MRWALSMVMMTALTGCASVEDPFLTGSVSGMRPSAPALTQEISPTYALAGLTPAIGAPRSVRQTAEGGENTIRQIIVYANTTKLAGENVLVVEGGKGGDGRYGRAPSRNQLVAEMNRALPGVPMRISSVIGENAYGVYGYATGPYAGGACIYGWQAAQASGSAPGRLLGGAYPTQVRLRYCDARISEERIPLVMGSLTLKPLNAATIATLRDIRGSALASATPLLGNDMLFDVPVDRAATPSIASAYVESRPVAVAPSAPRPVAARPVSVAAIAAPPQPVAPAVSALKAEKPAISLQNAARVPMPGEQISPADAIVTAAPPAESSATQKRKAAEAWSAARARMSGTDEQASR